MIEINLLPPEFIKVTRTKGSKPGLIEAKPVYFIYIFPLIFAILVIINLILFAVGFSKGRQLNALNNQWKALEPQRKSLEGFNKEYAGLTQEARSMQQLMQQRVEWAEKLNTLSLLLPPGIWFDEISINARDFTLRASVISLQKDDMGLINKFIESLKSDPEFSRDFNKIELSSVQAMQIGGYEVTAFTLTATLKAG